MDPPSSLPSGAVGSSACGSVCACACVKTHTGAFVCIRPLVCYSRTKAMTLLLNKTPEQGHRLENQTGGEDGN